VERNKNQADRQGRGPQYGYSDVHRVVIAASHVLHMIN
jgi:hypothetical protein